MSWERTGTTIFDRYVLGAQIARGGMSEVYHATDKLRTRPAAAKLLSPAFALDPRARDMAQREAWVMRQVRHPSVPVLYDFGDAMLRDGSFVPCTVMEFLTGIMLTERLERGPLPWAEAVKVAATIADALAVSHRRGIVHRDLTSENLMLTPTGVKIIDFGLAGTIDGNDSWMGRAARRSHRDGGRPETARDARDARQRLDPINQVGDPADDVYSLGVLLYQMLTGRSPYATGGGGHAAAARLRSVAPTPVLTVVDLPRAVADTCRSCMARRPTDRPTSAAAALALWSVLMPQSSPHVN